MAPPQLTDAPQSSTPQEWLSTLPGELCAQDTDLLGRVQLNCSDRGLMSVPQALSPNTEVLILSHNSLTSVSLSSLKDLPQLRNLDLSNNQIAHFQADYRLPLERLDLSHNKLSVIPRLSSLARLEGLQLASNAISALSDQAFGGLGNLKDLNLQDNQIEDISGHAFDPLVQLKFLSLSSNRIQVLPPGSMDSLTGLETLDLSHNRISLISEDLVKKSLLAYVFLHHNPWHCGCEEVRYLRKWLEDNSDLVYNEDNQQDSDSVVCSTPPRPEPDSGPAARSRTLPGQYNNRNRHHGSYSATDVPQPSTPQEWLSTLPGELCAQDTDLQGRVQLNCSDRGLVSVPQALPPNTEVLILSHNSLMSVSLSSLKDLPQLRDLDLSHNQIAHFQADYRLPLEKLNLSNNLLTEIPDLKRLPSLKELSLNHNEVSDVAVENFVGLRELVDLSLSGNRIQGLPNGVFDGLDTLRFLSLSSNQISLLPELLLKHLDLAGLDLSRNRLTTIPQGFFEGKNLSFVFLHSNRWHCDCTVQYLTSWSAENNGNVYTERDIPDPKGFVCASPPELQGTPVVRFPARQLCQATTETETRVHTAPLTLGSVSEPWTTPNTEVTTDRALTEPPRETGTPTSPGQLTPTNDGTTASHDDLSSVPPIDPDWARRTGGLGGLTGNQLNCFVLLVLHVLSLLLLLLQITGLLVYMARFYWRVYRPLRDLPGKRLGIRLIRYSLLVPYVQQLYPPLDHDSELDEGSQE
eukprot:gi/632989390/ref/XP_007883623.1/ PREDICTED: LOW QUALITY PROTEIN: slit homolog 3 protein-like [Callorhinchus milii]